MTLDELKQLSDDDINRRVLPVAGWMRTASEGDLVSPDGTVFQAWEEYEAPIYFAASYDAIIPAVRTWANGDGEREAAVLRNLPVTDASGRHGVLFTDAPRDLCHALILADEQTKGS